MVLSPTGFRRKLRLASASLKERGSVTVLLVSGVVAVGMVFVASQRVTTAARERAIAQSAADAIALGAAATPEADAGIAASILARYNDTSIVRIQDEGGEVEVTVRYGRRGAVGGAVGGADREVADGAVATARAERSLAEPKLVTIDVWVPLPD